MEPLAASVKAPASLVTVPVDVPVTMTVAPAMGEPDCRSTTVPWSNDWAASAAGMISDSRADTTRCMRHDPGSSWTGDSSALAEPDRPSAHGQLLTRVQERWTRRFTRPYPMHYEFRDENVAKGQTPLRRGRPLAHQLPLLRILRERGRAAEFLARFITSAKLREQIAAYRGKQVIAPEPGLCRERIHDRETGRRSDRHAVRHRAVELHDGRRRDERQRVVERRDAGPVGIARHTGAGMTGRDGGLQRVRAGRLAQRVGSRERHQATANEQLVPARPVLIEQEYRLARRSHARAQA